LRAPLRSLANIFYSGVSGVTFENENVLIGAGAGSIGAEVLQGLISGAARVVATTSGFSHQVPEYYQAMCSKFRSRSSRLVVVPFNQGMNFVLGIYILKLMTSQEVNRMPRPSFTASMMRRMV